MAHTYSHLFNLPTTGIRLFTVYGTWDRPDMAPILFANAITKDTPIKVFNNGNLERDFTYINDIIEGVARVIDNNSLESFSSINKEEYPKNEGEVVNNSKQTACYKIHNIGNGTPVNLMDFIDTIEDAIGKKAEKQMLPMQPGDVHKTFADVSALKKEFNYTPNTSLKSGITEFIKWYKSYYNY